MRLRNFLIAVAVLALAVPGFAQAESSFKVTGGGQAFATTDDGERIPAQGPGDTYGFNAQATGPAEDGTYPAKGQFQTIQRDASAETAKGRPESKFHGTVTCLQAVGNDGGVARFGGYERGGNSVNGPFFVVEVTDAGQGAENTEGDMVVFESFVGDPENDEEVNPCEEFEPENDETNLARGNVKIHNDPNAQGEGGALLLGL